MSYVERLHTQRRLNGTPIPPAPAPAKPDSLVKILALAFVYCAFMLVGGCAFIVVAMLILPFALAWEGLKAFCSFLFGTGRDSA